MAAHLHIHCVAEADSDINQYNDHLNAANAYWGRGAGTPFYWNLNIGLISLTYPGC